MKQNAAFDRLAEKQIGRLGERLVSRNDRVVQFLGAPDELGFRDRRFGGTEEDRGQKTEDSEGKFHLKSLSNSLWLPIHAHSTVSPRRLPTTRISRLTLTDQ